MQSNEIYGIVGLMEYVNTMIGPRRARKIYERAKELSDEDGMFLPEQVAAILRNSELERQYMQRTHQHLWDPGYRALFALQWEKKMILAVRRRAGKQ